MTWQILEGDCFDILPSLTPGSARVVIADPPYIIGGTSVGDPRSKCGGWSDMMNAARWYATWFESCARLLQPSGGYVLVFGNWRSLPTYLRATSMSSLFPSSCMVWDKKWIGPAPERALRPRYEIILWLSSEGAKIADRGIPDIISEKWMAGNSGVSGHPAEKPRSLLRRLISYAVDDDRSGLVVDPFCGSASSGLAALDLGMDYIGIESDPAWVERAERNLQRHGRRRANWDGVVEIEASDGGEA